jgi:hypothetical protein
MSSFSPTTYISELDDRFKHDRRSDGLQNVDIEALYLVRKALQDEDLFLIILVRNCHHILFCSGWELTRCPTIQIHHALVSPDSHFSSFGHHEVAHGLDLVRNLLAIPGLSDQTRSFLSVFFAKIHTEWNKIDSGAVKKWESQLEICLKSLDVLETLGEASSTLSQTFHTDLPHSVYLADGVDSYHLVPPRMAGTLPTIITPNVQLETPCTGQLRTTPYPKPCTRSPRLMFLLKLLHRPISRMTEAFSSKNLPSGVSLKINKFSCKPENGTLFKDITCQLMIHHGVEVEIEETSVNWGEISHFAVAIERWIVWRRQDIVETCKTIPKQMALSSITSSVAPISGAATDVIATSSVIKIDLFEPFSRSRIFDIPVRGASCLHHDAFDLKVFLETRSTPFNTDRLPLNDWRCPICSAECTPDKLVKDGFLVEVRERLRAKDQLDTRSIIVDRKGNWQQVVENAIRVVVLDAET